MDLRTVRRGGLLSDRAHDIFVNRAAERAPGAGAPTGPSALPGHRGVYGVLQSFFSVGRCIEFGGKALERLSSHAEPGLLNQQLLAGQMSRLQHEVGAGEARGAYGTVDYGLIFGCDPQVPAQTGGGGHGAGSNRASLAKLVDRFYHCLTGLPYITCFINVSRPLRHRAPSCFIISS